MDFKVIQLTFNSDGVQTVIPAVQDPIAFIGGGISGDPELSNDDPIMAWLCTIGFILGAVVSLGLELWLLSMLLGNDASVLEVILALLLFVAFAYVDYLFVDLMCGLIVGYGGLGLGWI